MFFGVPIVMAYNLFACILRALGDGKTPLHAMIVASFVNIALDLLFVLVFHWGIAGAAVATLIAQLVSSLFCLWHIRRIDILSLHREHFRLRPAMVKRLLFLSSPMAFQNAVISIGGMIVQSVVNGFGVIFIAGFTATNKLYGVLEIAATSYGYSMITYVGQNLGAKRIDRIRHGMRAAVIVAVLTSIVIAGVMLLFGRGILGWFISGTPQEVAQTLDVAYFYLAIMSAFLPVLYILHVARSAIQEWATRCCRWPPGSRNSSCARRRRSFCRWPSVKPASLRGDPGVGRCGHHPDPRLFCDSTQNCDPLSAGDGTAGADNDIKRVANIGRHPISSRKAHEIIMFAVYKIAWLTIFLHHASEYGPFPDGCSWCFMCRHS